MAAKKNPFANAPNTRANQTAKRMADFRKARGKTGGTLGPVGARGGKGKGGGGNI